MKTQKYVEKVEVKYSVNGSNGYDHHEDEEHFIQHVSHLPLVALTLSRVSQIYQATKLRNALLALALEKGEDLTIASWMIASQLATKTGLQRPLNYADTTAVHFLKALEERLPVITYTPEEIAYHSRWLYNEKVRPRVDQLTDMKESTVLKYNETKDKLWLVKGIGFSSAKCALILNPLHKLSQTVEWTLKAADLVVDKLLPQNERDNFVSSYVDPESENPNIEHAKIISNKIRVRVSARLADNMQAAQQLAQALHIVHALRETAEHSTASIQHMWEEIRRLSLSMTGQWSVLDVGENISRSDVEGHALTLLQRLTAQTKETLEKTLPDVTRFLPQPLADTLHSASNVAGNLLHQVREAQSVHDLSQPLIAQAHSYVEQVQVSVKAVLDTLTETYLLTWVIPQYNSIGSLDIHIHG